MIDFINHYTKLIIAHSPQDEIIPYEQGRNLYEYVATFHPNVQFINISGTHDNLFITDQYIYAISDLYQ